MLQWWEKEATHTHKKNPIKSNIVQMKTFLKLHVWKQLSNGGYHGAVINKTKQNKIYTKKNVLYIEAYFYVVFISRHIFNIILYWKDDNIFPHNTSVR